MLLAIRNQQQYNPPAPQQQYQQDSYPMQQQQQQPQSPQYNNNGRDVMGTFFAEVSLVFLVPCQWFYFTHRGSENLPRVTLILG